MIDKYDRTFTCEKSTYDDDKPQNYNSTGFYQKINW